MTIRGYISAIARVHKLCNLQDPSDDRCFLNLFCNFDLERPRTQTLVPKWSLEPVLDMLEEPPFVSLDTISPEKLTQKTVFLVTLLVRVSERHPLSARPGCLRFDQHGLVSIITYPEFLAKTRRPEMGNRQ